MGELTERIVAQARRFAESGAAPVEPRLSATVLLLRPGSAGLPGSAGFEVYLLRRVAGMAFASQMYAFPGGTVDPGDFREAGSPDGGPAGWAARLGRPAREAEAVVRAAVREVAEETGVHLDPGDLAPWSRWITPEWEPRRYDTWFFLAALPAGQQPADVSGEADRTEWTTPAEALARLEAGEIAMLPPTVVSLAELAECRTLEAALAAATGRDAATPVLLSLADFVDTGDAWRHWRR